MNKWWKNIIKINRPLIFTEGDDIILEYIKLIIVQIITEINFYYIVTEINFCSIWNGN